MRTQTMSIQQFMNPVKKSNKVKKEIKVQDLVNAIKSCEIQAAITSGVLLTTVDSKVFAYPEAVPVLADGVKNQIMHAFDPLINLVQLLAYPIGFVMISGGCLFIMCGNREKGMGMIQTAAIGYILVQLAPLLMKILVGIGSAV